MLTCRELSVCATKLGVYGMFCGLTVMTVTSGTGRCGGGASFEQPAASTAAAASHATDRTGANARQSIGALRSRGRPAARRDEPSSRIRDAARREEVCPSQAAHASARRHRLLEVIDLSDVRGAHKMGRMKGHG